MAVVLPIVRAVRNHYALECGSRIFQPENGCVATAVAGPVYAFGKRVRKEFRAVEMQPFGRGVLPMYFVTVIKPLACTLDEHVPIMVRPVFLRIEFYYLVRNCIFGIFEKPQFYASGIFGIHGKINPSVGNGRTQRRRLTGRNAMLCRRRRFFICLK